MAEGERERLSSRMANLKVRHSILRSIREHFDGQGFLEVETPVMVPSPGLDVHLDAFEVLGAGGSRFLHTSPEYQMKRLLVGGCERIYQVSKAFRRAEHGHLHQPEFCMLEWYRTDAGSQEVMADTEQLVERVARAVTGDSRLPGVEAEVDVSLPWPRLSVAEAFERYSSMSMQAALADEDTFFRALIDEVEPRLGRGRPTFLTHYPASMASLARLHPDDPSVADRFEAYVDGVELCNGFGELTDAAEQRRRLEVDRRRRAELEKPVYPVDEAFLRALEEGMTPSGGNALGVDRLVMLATGANHIRDVVAFETTEL